MTEYERLLKHAGVKSAWDLPSGAYQLGRYARSNDFPRSAYPENLPSLPTFQSGWDNRAWELENEIPGVPLARRTLRG